MSDAAVRIRAREVPLGESDGLHVRRTLPTRDRSLIGGWCFIDHFGPSIPDGGGMQVPPHPHTELQTVSWLFEGEIEHRDSAGHHAIIRPGQLNIMTAGRGIAHSERSIGTDRSLHGVQLWIALPAQHRHVEPGFENFEPSEISIPGGTALVFLGSMFGSTSPAVTYSPLVGAELRLDAGVHTVTANLNFEYGVLVDAGVAVIEGVNAAASDLVAIPAGNSTITIEATEPVRLLLLGGEPLGEQIVMWWNFIGRTHEDVVAYREQWQLDITGGKDIVFGTPFGDTSEPLAAPQLPPVVLKPRG